MKPAVILLIPAGISHRSTGTADNLRLVVKVRDPLNVLLTEKDHIGHTEYTNKRIGGPDWKIPAGAEKPNKGKVEERLLTWADKPGSLTVVQREYDRLVGVADEGGREIAKVRAFDTFSGVAGRSQKAPGPHIFVNDVFKIEVYNTDGEQYGFHRGNRNDEFQLQFMGDSTNLTEFGSNILGPGQLEIIPRGIAHKIVGCEGFRRLVLYSEAPWEVQVDLAKPAYNTTFEVTESVIAAAAWRGELLSQAAE